MFHELKVSHAKMAVCKIITFDKDSQSLPQDHHEFSFIIEENNLVKKQKGKNETKGEREDKGDIGQINQTEINQLKHELTGWIVIYRFKLSSVIR